MNTIRRIAMIYREIGTLGGIPRDAELLDKLFRDWGYEPMTFAERDLGADDTRGPRLEKILRERKVDLVIEHDAYDVTKLSNDIAAAHAAGVRIVVFWHSVFSWMFAMGFPRAAKIFDIIRTADAVISLSPTDEAFFRLCGCRSLFIPSIDDDRMKGFVRQGNPHRVVWLGRLSGLKQPLDAVKIMERVRETVPDAELEILGDGDAPVKAEIKRYLSSRSALKAAIHFRGCVKDVDPFLKTSGVGLVTSRFEGFPHSIIEMKMAALPVVSYAMPYLVMLKCGTGAVQVPQGDVDAAASEIVRLFADEEECTRQGNLARSSYEKISAFDQRGAYERLFADLGKPDGESALLSIDPSAARNVMAVFAEHSVAGFLAIRERLSAGEARKGLIGSIGRFMVKVGRRLCRL